ncbi:MAG: hypothetical protein J7623_24085 [Chitinophaga sp.]|uniref:hypothetical protein n=1 Tax=Chitinophaga sp. TaxID=1869181 RepID=UPI001B0839FE|nr:hypothetical protein [Chitinophaga sp.]MBO9731742.1 hypothetical protein [Chitinophaga sp.]
MKKENSAVSDILLMSRIRTGRQRKRAAIKAQDKALLRLKREQDALSKAYRNRGCVPLEPPVMKGYNRFFVLRDDVARSRDATFFQGILDKINTTNWCAEKGFRVSKRYKRRHRYADFLQQLYEPTEAEFKKMDFSPRALQYFEEWIKIDKRSGKPVRKYVFTDPWRFILRVRPNWITQQWIHAPELESRMDEIDDFLDRNNLRPRFGKLVYGKYISRRKEWRYDPEGRFLVDRHVLPYRFMKQDLEEGIGGKIFVNLKRYSS